MFIKKLYNNLDTLVDESILGNKLMTGDPYSMILPNSKITIRTPAYRKPKGLVKVAIGGGSGHEGPPDARCKPGGMDAYIAGDVFAAPSSLQFLRAIQEIDDGSPIVLQITNHAGDVLNAKLCLQFAREMGIDLHMALLYNDVASAPKGQEKERRALRTCINLAGIMAECGEPVEEILRVNEKTNVLTRTYAVGIRSAIHPETGLPIMEMPEDEIEMGIGIHGESSGNRIKLPRCRDLARMVCDIMTEDLPLSKGDEIAVKLSGLGGMTWMELDILFKDIYEYLVEEKGIKLFDISVINSGTQELGGFIFAYTLLDEELKKWMRQPIPDRYPIL